MMTLRLITFALACWLAQTTMPVVPQPHPVRHHHHHHAA
jgi:hypothetical protein